MRISDLSSDVCSSDLAYKSPVGTLTGFAYLVDQDETVVLAKSSQTYGARFAGAHPLTKAVKLSYAASYARQSDYRNNPNDYSAEYYLVEAGLRSEEHTSELQSLMRISYAVFCLTKKKHTIHNISMNNKTTISSLCTLDKKYHD